MKSNRSIPAAGVMPVLSYPDIDAAVAWLVRAFGCEERLRIHGHRVQLTLSGGALVATQSRDGEPAAVNGAYVAGGHALLVRVEDADRHHDRARAAGADILAAPADHPYGERQYTARDIGGHVWTFSQSVADVDPASWGGELVARD